MKRIAYVWLSAMMLAGMLVAAAGAQSDSLGDYARSVRKGKKTAAAKQFDNDNLPQTDKLSVVGQPPASDSKDNAEGKSAEPANDANAPAPNADGSDKAKDAAANSDKKPSDSDAAAEKQKLWDEWQKKIAEQKDKIDLQTRELDVMQREYKLRAAAMYGDVGNRLRNSASWDKEDAQYKQQIAEKQKALDAAKQGLEDMQEQARKAGVPTSKRE